MYMCRKLLINMCILYNVQCCAEYGVYHNELIMVSHFFLHFFLHVCHLQFDSIFRLFSIMRLSVGPETCDQQHGTTRSTYGNKLNRLSKTYEMIKLAEHLHRNYYQMNFVHHHYVINVLRSRYSTSSFALSVWIRVSCELIVYLYRKQYLIFCSKV